MLKGLVHPGLQRSLTSHCNGCVRDGRAGDRAFPLCRAPVYVRMSNVYLANKGTLCIVPKIQPVKLRNTLSKVYGYLQRLM